MQVRILLLEDNSLDAELIESELANSNIPFVSRRVDSKKDFVDAFHTFRPNLILSDFSMPSFDGMSALAISREHLPEVPFIFVSGTIGEEKAIEALRNGATDYVLKDRPARLGSSVLRALREAEERRVRKHAEQEWRKSEELFRLITENVADLISVLDLDGRHIYSNRSYQLVFGREESRRGKDAFAEVHPDDRETVKDLFFETVRTGTGHRAEFRHVGRDGSLRFIESSGSVIRDSEGKVSKVVIVSRDVTERKQAEMEREQLEDQLRQAQKMESVGTLAGGVAHDFNNILSIILGYSSLLETNQLPPDDSSKAYANISKAAVRGGAVVKQLMTFARKSDVIFAATDVNVLVQELMSMLSATFPKTITLFARLDPLLPIVTADAGQLNQTLLNLCVNARDAMPHGGTLTIKTETAPAEFVRARFGEAADELYVGIHVEDSGLGMDEQTQRRMFEPFFTTKPLGKGTGLGLAMAYGVVKGHDGFIDVESAPEKGTSFHLFLPVRQGISASPVLEQPLEEVRGGDETILFVEDEEMLLDLVGTLLRANGYRVFVARNGREAVEMYKEHASEVDLVVSDFGLPEMGGLEVLQNIRKINPHVKTIFVSGYVEEDLKEETARSGAVRVIQKPYVPSELLGAIRAAIDVHQQPG